MITKEQIQELSKKLLIDNFSILREYLQIVLLTNLYDQKESQEIFFKGGTAIRLLFNSFRFSEDLDFTARLTKGEIEKVVKKTIEKISLVVPNIGFKTLYTKYESFSGTFSYKDEQYKNPMKIHLEFSYRENPITSKESVLETVFPVSSYPIVMHLDWNEILAEKIRALITRAKGRDLFDLYYLLSKDIRLDLNLVNKKLEYYKKKTDLQEIIDKIKSFDEKKLINDLNKYLPSNQRKLTSKLKELILNKLQSR